MHSFSFFCGEPSYLLVLDYRFCLGYQCFRLVCQLSTYDWRVSNLIHPEQRIILRLVDHGISTTHLPERHRMTVSGTARPGHQQIYRPGRLWLRWVLNGMSIIYVIHSIHVFSSLSISFLVNSIPSSDRFHSSSIPCSFLHYPSGVHSGLQRGYLSFIPWHVIIAVYTLPQITTYARL